MAADPKALDCLACPALCCRQAGYVEVTVRDIRRLAKFLGLTVRAFEAKHIVETTRREIGRASCRERVCAIV